MAALLITAPVRDTFDNPLVERNPRKVAEWLDQLPLLNPAGTVTQLLDALQPLNRQPLADKERLRLLDLYQRAVSAVFNAFTQRALRQALVPAAQRERIKQDLTHLCLEMAGGYKGVVLQAYEQGRSPALEPALLRAAYRAMEHLAYALLHSYRIYGPIPPRVLLEIHQLYAWAEQAGVCDAPVDPEWRTGTLGALYRRILLLCCADPARLGEDDVLSVYALLEQYAPHCRILTGPCAAPHEGRFAFDLCADAPPRPCAKLDAHYRPTQARVLDACEVANAVRANARNEQVTAIEEERRLLRMLLSQIESTPQRGTPRLAVQRPALVTPGISAIHYYLSDNRRLTQGIDHARQGISVQDIDDAGDHVPHALDPWSVSNESDTGYMLRYPRPHAAVRVGELLGVLLLDCGETRTMLELTVVRWMRHGTDGSLEVGVERIFGAAAAVLCHETTGAEPAPPAQNCLFLPSSSAHEIPATLLAPKRLYARGRQLRVAAGARIIMVEAGHLVMDTACFDRFTFHAQRDESLQESAPQLL